MDDAGGTEGRWRIRPPEQLAWKAVGDEVVILDLRTSMYLTLNGSATLLWMALMEGATTVELAQRLVDAFGVDTESATVDVAAFLATCQAQDLLEPT